MSAALRVLPNAPPSAVEVFAARCEARALLYRVGALELHESVDILQYTAIRTGLVDELGQDRVQKILSEAFERYADD
jgi:hypothetical protein